MVREDKKLNIENGNSYWLFIAYHSLVIITMITCIIASIQPMRSTVSFSGMIIPPVIIHDHFFITKAMTTALSIHYMR